MVRDDDQLGRDICALGDPEELRVKSRVVLLEHRQMRAGGGKYLVCRLEATDLRAQVDADLRERFHFTAKALAVNVPPLAR